MHCIITNPKWVKEVPLIYHRWSVFWAWNIISIILILTVNLGVIEVFKVFIKKLS